MVPIKYTYLLVNLGSFIVPFLFSFHPSIQFNKHFSPFLKGNLIVTSLFILWDMFFTHLGVWGFNPKYILGIYLFNLPIEEWLFFIMIPFACSFTYFCIQKFVSYRISKRNTEYISLFLIVTLLSIGIYHFNRLYTVYTSISLSITLILMIYRYKVAWLSSLYWIYIILLIPFFVTNGILTGTGLNEPVVWYNNDENLRMRILTVPVEDMFYGFEMIVLNIFFLEKWKVKH